MDKGVEFPVDQIRQLLDHVVKTAYKAREGDTNAEGITNTCLGLFGKDYKFSVLHNNNGELCSHYPTKIPILEYESICSEKVESLYDAFKLKELVNRAKFARCRGRFAVPVILYEGKHICRGATISGGVELYGRSGIDFFFSGGEATSQYAGEEINDSDGQLFNRIRGLDIKLLKTFSIGYICDLMVEKKKVKFGMNVTSSEKVDKENRYSDFNIVALPYPGCEFFKTWRDNGYMAEGLMYDWGQGFVDATLDLPRSKILPPQHIDWHRYKAWDLAKLSQNYLQLLLRYVKGGETGLLIHCISGWDRTPLFVSLLRLSLWADGVIHQSLGPVEILYLTIAYDWFLFGHNFPDRLSKGEDIFFFCFNFLKYITGDEYAVTSNSQERGRTVSRTDSECLIDGVLLDPDLQRASYRGSNTSINSGSSLNSTRSSVDNPPVFFVPDEESTSAVPNGSSVAHHAYTTRVSPVNKQPPTDAYRGPPSSHFSTSPMAVPTSIKRVTEVKNSPCYGSWQMITGTGSLRESPCSQESYRSSVSDHSSGHTHSSSGSHHTCEAVMEESPRKQKLDAVRRIFLTVYTSMSQFRPGAETGGISGLMGHFAEKVGIRASRSTPV